MFQAGVKVMSERSELIPCIYTSIKNNYKKLKGSRDPGWSTKKHTNKGSKDGNKGQGSFLLIFVLSLWLFITVPGTCWKLFLSNLVMMTKK